MSEEHFDLAVIGAGPGGYTAAIRAAQLGKRVTIIEQDPTLGGTCLNIGCIPSKALLESSERYYEAKSSLADHGVNVGDISLDLPAMMARKDKVVGSLTTGIAGLMKKNKITVQHGTACIKKAGRVEVTDSAGDRTTVKSTSILIATGSTAVELPHIPFDGTRVISSTEALLLDHVPERMLVIGGGAIGLEMGSVWARLGADVVVAELMDQVVPGADRQMARLLQRALAKQGLEFKLSTNASSVEVDDEGVTVTLQAKSKEEAQRFDVVLVAVGRCAHTGGLGAIELGIDTDERGRIVVDAGFQTTVPGVYAIGDVIAGPMLAHKAEEEGVAFAERLAGGAGHVRYDAIPSVVYTEPELASVGLTEEAAKTAGRKIRKGAFPFMANGRAKAMGQTEGSVKVLADAETDEVVGVHIVGPRASELIAEAALAMEMGASAEDIARTVHAHPTLAEALKEAALGVDKRSITI